MSFSAIALLVSGLAGVVGWIVAWRSRGETLDVRKQLAEAARDLADTQTLALQQGLVASTADAKWQAEMLRSAALESQLAAERQSRQSLVDALAKSGAPVGDLLVDGALDELYADQGSGGSRPRSNTGGGSNGVPVIVTGTTRKTNPG